MSRQQQTQYPAAKKCWEARMGQKVVPVRLSEDYRAKLDLLTDRYGGKRQVIEAGIDALLAREEA